MFDQAVVIGIEKKEDKWHEKWGLASLYDNLVPSSSFRRPCYTLLLCELETNDTLDQREGKNLWFAYCLEEITILKLRATSTKTLLISMP